MLPKMAKIKNEDIIFSKVVVSELRQITREKKNLDQMYTLYFAYVKHGFRAVSMWNPCDQMWNVATCPHVENMGNFIVKNILWIHPLITRLSSPILHHFCFWPCPWVTDRSQMLKCWSKVREQLRIKLINGYVYGVKVCKVLRVVLKGVNLRLVIKQLIFLGLYWMQPLKVEEEIYSVNERTNKQTIKWMNVGFLCCLSVKNWSWIGYLGTYLRKQAL